MMCERPSFEVNSIGSSHTNEEHDVVAGSFEMKLSKAVQMAIVEKAIVDMKEVYEKSVDSFVDASESESSVVKLLDIATYIEAIAKVFGLIINKIMLERQQDETFESIKLLLDEKTPETVLDEFKSIILSLDEKTPETVKSLLDEEEKPRIENQVLQALLSNYIFHLKSMLPRSFSGLSYQSLQVELSCRKDSYSYFKSVLHRKRFSALSESHVTIIKIGLVRSFNGLKRKINTMELQTKQFENLPSNFKMFEDFRKQYTMDLEHFRSLLDWLNLEGQELEFFNEGELQFLKYNIHQFNTSTVHDQLTLKFQFNFKICDCFSLEINVHVSKSNYRHGHPT